MASNRLPREKQKKFTGLRIETKSLQKEEKKEQVLSSNTAAFAITPDSRGTPDDLVTLANYLETFPGSADYMHYEKANEVKVEVSANVQTGLAGPHKLHYSYIDDKNQLIEKTQNIYIKKFESSEKIAADLQNAIFPGLTASVLRIKSDKDRFDGSIMFDEFEPGYRVLHKQYNEIHPESPKTIPDKRPQNAKTRWQHIVKDGLFSIDEKTNEPTPYHLGLYKLWAGAIFTANFDIHWGNIGLVTVSNKGSGAPVYDEKSQSMIYPEGRGAIVASDEKKETRKEWRMFDFGWCFHNTVAAESFFDPIHKKNYDHIALLHINSHSRHAIPGKPTNHFTEIPNEFLFREPFAVELDKVANQDSKTLKKIILKNIKNIAADLGVAGLEKFAKHIGLKLDLEKAEPQLIARMCQITQARQAMCGELAFSIRLSHCINKTDYSLDKTKFNELLAKYPLYAFYIDHAISTKASFHFRGDANFKQHTTHLSSAIKDAYIEANKDNELLNKAQEAFLAEKHRGQSMHSTQSESPLSQSASTSKTPRGESDTPHSSSSDSAKNKEQTQSTTGILKTLTHQPVRKHFKILNNPEISPTIQPQKSPTFHIPKQRIIKVHLSSATPSPTTPNTAGSNELSIQNLSGGGREKNPSDNKRPETTLQSASQAESPQPIKLGRGPG